MGLFPLWGIRLHLMLPFNASNFPTGAVESRKFVSKVRSRICHCHHYTLLEHRAVINRWGQRISSGFYECGPQLISQVENRRNIVPKEIPSCFIPHLIVVFTQQLKMLVTSLPWEHLMNTENESRPICSKSKHSNILVCVTKMAQILSLETILDYAVLQISCMVPSSMYLQGWQNIFSSREVRGLGGNPLSPFKRKGYENH